MAEQSDFQSLIHLLVERMDRQETRMDRQEAQQQTTNDLLLRLVNQQEAMFSLHQNFQQRQEKFNDRQDKFNERQDHFNIIFLDEIREVKKDVRNLAEVVLKQHESRLKKLEDFMDGFMRKAS